MDIIEIKYNGKKLSAKKDESKKEAFLVRLSDVEESEFRIKKRMAKITDDCIQMVSVDSKHEDEISVVWLFSDGTIKHEDFISRMFKKGPETAERKFDPNGDNAEFPYSVAQELYTIKSKVNSVLEKKRGIDKIRRMMLDLRLRRLGYESQEDALSLLTDYSVGCDLNVVVQDLENFASFDKLKTADKLREIPGFSRVVGDDIIYTEPSDEVSFNIVRLLQEVVEKYKSEKGIVYANEEMTEQRRRLLQDFADRFAVDYAVGVPGILSRTDKEWKEYVEYIYNQGKKYLKSLEDKKSSTKTEDSEKEGQTEELNESEPKRSILVNNMIWNRYIEQLRVLAKLYMGLTPDLLDEQVASQIEDFTKLKGIEYDDRISEILDSYKLGEAIDVENIFVIAINLDFIPQAEAILNSDPSISGTSVGESIRELINDSTAKIAARIECIERRRKLERISPSMKKPHHDENPEGGPGGDNR